MKQMDREKVIKGVHDTRRYLEDREWVDKSVGVHIDAINDALAMLKEQDAVVKQWTKEIADNQLAHAPDEQDEGEDYQYKKGIWDGLQIAWNIISEGR